MTFLNKLEAALNIPEAAYIKFLQQYRFDGNSVHFFFEGLEDQSFYVGYIEAIYPQNYQHCYYVCNGKDNVQQNYRDINWSVYDKNRGLFFIDKDLDDILGISSLRDENIFTTEYYSIENYLVTTEIYERFLREICFINDDQVITDLTEKFRVQHRKFSGLILKLSAWVVFCRKNNYDVKLNDIDMSNIFAVNSSLEVYKKIDSKYTSVMDYIRKATKTNYFDFSQIKRIMASLKSVSEPKKYIRGKYEFWFLYAFCKNTVDFIVPALNDKIKIYNRAAIQPRTKYKVTISIKPENILQIMAPRLRMPAEIKAFLERNLASIQMPKTSVIVKKPSIWQRISKFLFGS